MAGEEMEAAFAVGFERRKERCRDAGTSSSGGGMKRTDTLKEKDRETVSACRFNPRLPLIASQIPDSL